MQFKNIEKAWEVTYKSKATGEYIAEIIYDEELLNDFVDNLGTTYKVQEIFS